MHIHQKLKAYQFAVAFYRVAREVRSHLPRGLGPLGARAWRSGLSAAARRDGTGERIVITVGGRPVAQLGPLEPTDEQVTLEALAARGQVVLARRVDRPAPEFSMPLWAGTRIDQLIREVRGR